MFSVLFERWMTRLAREGLNFFDFIKLALISSRVSPFFKMDLLRLSRTRLEACLKRDPLSAEDLEPISRFLKVLARDRGSCFYIS